MSNERLEFLFSRYLDSTISTDQYLELSTWINTHVSDEELIGLFEKCWNEPYTNEKISDEKAKQILQAILGNHQNTALEEIEEPITKKTTKFKVFSIGRIAVAASLLLFVSLSYLMMNRKSSPAKTAQNTIKTKIENDVEPGGQKAVLILGDGSHIVLDSSGNGVVARQGNSKVVKLNNGELKYAAGSEGTTEVLYNTMTTPPGGKYNLTLSDGTKVWLNSSSSIHFPTSFVGGIRNVEITGEAYFEVAKNDKQPFVVKFNSVEVKVLGTHFNVNAYSDETESKTTLLEGSITISKGDKSRLLKPGNQASINKSGDLNVMPNANTEEAVAWKNGYFQFKSTDLKTVLRKAARWYNLSVEFTANDTVENKFTGKIPMSVTLSQLLKYLEWSGVRFKIDGHKLTVQP